ncbi:MAG TPA: hypothetical protein VIP05_11845 [Burkholderiaceae bacterium]
MTSRPAPPKFESCSIDGVRFEADYALVREAPRTRTGGIAAVDEATGRTLWSAVLWTSVDDHPALSIPPRYLRRVSRGDGPDELLVEDEHGFRYVVDSVTHATRALGRAGGSA